MKTPERSIRNTMPRGRIGSARGSCERHFEAQSARKNRITDPEAPEEQEEQEEQEEPEEPEDRSAVRRLETSRGVESQGSRNRIRQRCRPETRPPWRPQQVAPSAGGPRLRAVVPAAQIDRPAPTKCQSGRTDPGREVRADHDSPTPCRAALSAC